jgi:hypothetical protein
MHKSLLFFAIVFLALFSGRLDAQLYLNSQGNLGIGTQNPLNKLHIYSDPATALTLQGNDGWIGMNFMDGSDHQVAVMGFNNIGNGIRSFDLLNYKHKGMISFYIYDSTLSWPQPAKMVIDSLGRVGIGTSSPTSNLQVNGKVFVTGTDAQLDFNNNSGATERMIIRKNPGIFGEINVVSAHDLRIRTSDQDRITVLSGGNVGIGTTSPAEKLDVEGNLDMNQNQVMNMRIENRTSDPASPAVGQIWIRTDL